MFCFKVFLTLRRSFYQELYTVRRKELVSAQGRRSAKLKEECDRRKEETDKEYRRKADELERRYAHGR
jgi:hypothetical protein